MSYKAEFIAFMARAGVLTFGDFTTKSGRKTPYFINTGNYKTGAQIARLGEFYAACIAGLVFGILNNHWLAAGIALLIWLFRYPVQAIIINRTAKEMGGDRKYYFSLPVFDILQPIQSLKFKLYRSLRRKGDFMRR